MYLQDIDGVPTIIAENAEEETALQNGATFNCSACGSHFFAPDGSYIADVIKKVSSGNTTFHGCEICDAAPAELRPTGYDGDMALVDKIEYQ